MIRRLIAATPVDHPGGAETTLLRLLAGLQSAPDARIVVVGEDPYHSDPQHTRAVIESSEVEHHPPDVIARREELGAERLIAQ